MNLRTHWRLTTILRTSNKSLSSNVFWYVKVYTESLFNTQYIEIKFPLDKLNVVKNEVFFLSRAPTHHSFTFNLQFLYELKHMVHLPKTVFGVFHFWFCLLFIKVYIFVIYLDSLTSKCHNSFRNKNSRKEHTSFAPRPQIFKLQQEDWKFSDIRVSWSSPKTDLEMNLLNLENRRFEYVTFSQ